MQKKGGAGIIIAIVIIAGLIFAGVALYFVFSGEKEEVGDEESVIFNDKATGLIITSKGGLVPGNYVFVKYISSGLATIPTKMTNDEISLDKKVQIDLLDVSGWVLENERAFIGGSMSIVSSNGDVILNQSDMFSNYAQSGVSIEDSKIISPSFTTGTPMVVGETYTLSFKTWDLKGDGEINLEVDLKIVEPDSSEEEKIEEAKQ